MRNDTGVRRARRGHVGRLPGRQGRGGTTIGVPAGERSESREPLGRLPHLHWPFLR